MVVRRKNKRAKPVTRTLPPERVVACGYCLTSLNGLVYLLQRFLSLPRCAILGHATIRSACAPFLSNSPKAYAGGAGTCYTIIIPDVENRRKAGARTGTGITVRSRLAFGCRPAGRLPRHWLQGRLRAVGEPAANVFREGIN